MMSEGITMPAVFVLSDSAGETGEAVVKAAIIQFFPLAISIRRIPFIQNRAGIDLAIASAKAANGVIVFTLVIPELRDYLMEQAFVHQILSIDLLGPIISSLEKVLDRQARHEPGLIHQLDENYFKKVEAVEFAVKYDDGKDSRGILKADIILLGVSRTSKTPLSMYLAHMRYKVANVPLVPELKPPDELFTIPPHKIIGLRISTEKLNGIRRERLKALGLPDNANYASVDRIEQESEYANKLMIRLGCTIIDVSNKAVEETASIIQELFQKRE